MLKLVKLSNNIEIVGDVIDNSEYTLTISDPLQINYRQRNDMGPPAVSLHRYNPFANERDFIFISNHIMNISDPSPGLAKYYEAALKTIISSIDDTIEEELNYAAKSFSDYTEEELVREAIAEKMALKPTLN